MNPDMQELILQYNMISPGDHVICALSGGKDSMYLLHRLMELREHLGFTLSAAHLNHQLRGPESQRDLDFVTAHCAQFGIPLETDSRDVDAYAKAHRLGLEEAARTLRYNFLLGLSPSAKIATAHTADDNLETLLLHLLRGCSLHGLTGIPPTRGRIIRPLLLTDRGTIEDYLKTHHIPHVEDGSNQSDFCLRNRLRHHVVPLLQVESPNLPLSASGLSLQLLAEEEYLNQQARQELNTTPGALSVSRLKALPRNMQLRVMRLYLQDVPQLEGKHLVDCLKLTERDSPSAMFCLPGGYILRREYDVLRLTNGTPEPTPEPCSIGPGESCQFGPWMISCQPGPALPGQISLKPPPEGRFTLRSRATGDRISLPGGTKKLSRYLMDKKIPAVQRDTLPVVLSGDTLAAVLPLAADQHFSEQEGNDSLILTAIRMEEVK